VRHFFARVAGESFLNDDGTDRQTTIASCRVGEAVILDAEPDNPEDENAIRVLRVDGKQIGHLERGMAARLVDDLTDFSAFVAGIGRGGGPGYLGVSLLIVVNDGENAPVVEAYARRALAAEGNLGRSAPSIIERGRVTLRRPLRQRPSAGASPLRWTLLTVGGVVLGAVAVWWIVVAP
jgi:HIRAN domain